VTGPAWLAGALAAVVLTVALFGVGRLVLGWRRPRGEADADVVHVLMGVAMAGMFVPRLATLADSAWQIVFAAGATWFAWRAVRDRVHAGPAPHPGRVHAGPAPRPGRVQAGPAPHPGRALAGPTPHAGRAGVGLAAGPSLAGRGPWCACPVPHLVDCLAMVYVLWAVPAATIAGQARGTVPGMAGMSAAAGPARLPVIALALAAGICAYVVWLLDRLPSLRPVLYAGPGLAISATAAAPAPAARPLARAGPGPAAAPGSVARALPAARAPRAAACCKVAMGVAMGVMLISVL
jgi:hypothetical protein